MTSRGITDQAYVLHSLPYKETSLVVELFCREHGRLPVIAKGAKRPHSALRPVLVNFQPLEVRFTGRSEVKTLTHAEWAGHVLPPEGKSLFAAYYLNELLIRGLQREDSHAELFEAYSIALTALSCQEDMNTVVRRFELALLQHLGYGLDFAQDANGEPLSATLSYSWQSELGWQQALAHATGDAKVTGELLTEYESQGVMSRTLAAALRPVTRQLLLTHIAPNGLLSRTWMEHLLKND